MDTEGLRACGQHCARPRRPRLRVGPLPGLGASALPASGRLSLGGRAFRGAECVSTPPPGTLRVRDGEFSVTPSTCPPQSPPAVAVVLKKLLMGPCENWETRDL